LTLSRLTQAIQDEVDLAGVDVKTAFGPDDEIGAGDFVVDGELGGDALVDLGFGPTPLGEAGTLGDGRAGGADDGIEFGFGFGFEKEGNDDDRAVATLGTPDVDLAFPFGADAGMEDTFELLTGLSVAEDAGGQKIAAEAAIVAGELRTKSGLDLCEGSLARLDKLAGEGVGIGDGHAAFDEKVGGGGFTHADAAR
jgi:hypothetical protein